MLLTNQKTINYENLSQKADYITTSVFASANVFTILKIYLLNFNFNTLSSKIRSFGISKLHIM